jgi:hypothetical protein
MVLRWSLLQSLMVLMMALMLDMALVHLQHHYDQTYYRALNQKESNAANGIYQSQKNDSELTGADIL